MYSKNYTILEAAVEGGTEQVTNVSIDVNLEHMRPRLLKVNNTTGAIIGFVYTRDADEESERAIDPTNHEFYPLEAGFHEIELKNCENLIFKKISGTASTNLNFYCTNYFSSNY